MPTLCITNNFIHHVIIGSATHCRFQINRCDLEPGEPPQVREGATVEHISPPTLKWQGGYYTLIDVPPTVLDQIPRLEPHT